MAEFGTLARRLPQDPVPRAPAAYPFFRRSGNVDDRRAAPPLTGLEMAQLIMNAMDTAEQYPAAKMPLPQATPLAIDAGMLDVHPGHERWLAERIGATPSTITVSNR
jgi:hypothetical protein